MADLTHPKIICLKGALFGVILTMCAGLLVWAQPTWRTGLLVVLLIWSSARLYYFMFYVIEKYVDPEYRFAGIGSFLAYLVGKRRIGAIEATSKDDHDTSD